MPKLFSDQTIKKLTSNSVISFVFYLILNILLLPVLVFFIILRLFYDVRFIKLYDLRIGHLSGNTDLFFRRRKLGFFPANARFIALSSNKPSNSTLLDMIEREIRIIKLPHCIFNNFIFAALSSEKSVLSLTNVYQTIPFETNEYHEFTLAEKSLGFSSEEEKKGAWLLKKMGIPKGAWFVCFHARDNAYDRKQDNFSFPCNYSGGKDYFVHEFRNCNIDNYMNAAEYIASMGGYALRMGGSVDSPLDAHGSEHIIDYATKYRSEFGDVYLSANCKFFIGCTAGLWMIPQIFDVPVAIANSIPIHTPLRAEGLFIPKKLWKDSENRYLTFSEVLTLEVELSSYNAKRGLKTTKLYRTPDFYKKKGITIIENSPEEILELVKELNERIDDSWKTTERDKHLQQRFKALIPPKSLIYGTPARIGASFLRQNENLLK